MDKVQSGIEKRVEVELDAKRRAENCMIDIKKALAKWECKFSPIVHLSEEGINTSFRLLPLVKVPQS